MSNIFGEFAFFGMVASVGCGSLWFGHTVCVGWGWDCRWLVGDGGDGCINDKVDRQSKVAMVAAAKVGVH